MTGRNAMSRAFVPLISNAVRSIEPILAKPKYYFNMTPLMAPTHPDEEEYEVEEVLDYRTIGDRRQYLLKWKDYPASESTWEWEENLQCPDLLEKFKANLLLVTGVKKKTIKVSPLNPKAYVGPCPIGRSHPVTYKGPYQYRFHKYYS